MLLPYSLPPTSSEDPLDEQTIAQHAVGALDALCRALAGTLERHIFEGGAFNKWPCPARKHPNGGGWVALTAYVADTAYVGPDAEVWDVARVMDNAQVRKAAHVYHRAKIWGHARIDGEAEVFHEAEVGDFALIDEMARVGRKARVTGSAQVLESAQVMGAASVNKLAVTCGCVVLTDFVRVTGSVRLAGKMRLAGSIRVSDAGWAWGNEPPVSDADADALLKRIALIVLENPERLNMGDWHSECGTTHCLAGWAQALTNEDYNYEDDAYEAGVRHLGRYAARFFDHTEDVRAWLQLVAYADADGVPG